MLEVHVSWTIISGLADTSESFRSGLPDVLTDDKLFRPVVELQLFCMYPVPISCLVNAD